MPVKVNVPLPTLVNVFVPANTPAKVWLLPSPAVNAAVVKSIVPPNPAIDKTVSVALTL